MRRQRHRVLLYGDFSTIGGIRTHATAVALAAAQAGADVMMASARPDFLTANELAAAGVRRIGVGLGWQSRLQAFRRLLAEFGPRSFDVVCGFGQGGFLGLLAAMRRPGGFLIYTECNSGRGLRARQMMVQALVLSLVDGIVCFAPAVRKTIGAVYAPDKPMAVIPPLTCAGLSLPRRRPDGETRDGRPLRLSFLGRLEPVKSPEMLLDVVGSLDIGPVELSFHGEGSLAEPIRRQIVRRRLERVVRIHGPYAHTEIGRVLSETDVLVLPSQQYQEGLPLVLLESLAHGVPFVAGASGGTTDLAHISPHVEVVPSTEAEIVAAIRRVHTRLRTGQIKPDELQLTYQRHFAEHVVKPLWMEAILEPQAFWSKPLAAGFPRGRRPAVEGGFPRGTNPLIRA